MKRTIFTTLALLTLTACSPNQKTPDQIRQNAANLTTQASREAATAAQDARAVLQGIQDGDKSAIPLNLDTATEAYPTVEATEARKTLANRP